MRLRLFCAVFVILIALSGCSKSSCKDVVPKTQEFTCKISVTWKDFSVNAAFSRPNRGICTFTVSEPSELSGLEVSFGNDGIKTSYRGISFDIGGSGLSDMAFTKAIINVLDSLDKNENIRTYCDGSTYYFEGGCDSGKFLVGTDSDGFIGKIEISSLDLTVEFSDYKS